MRKVYLILPVLFICLAVSAQKNIIARNPDVVIGKLIKIGSPNPNWKDVKVRDENGIIGKEGQVENDEYSPSPKFPGLQKDRDMAVQSKQGANSSVAVSNGFSGLGYTQVCPADPTVAVSANYVLQMINGSSGAYFQVWDKNGNILLPRTYMDAITGKGGLGDPVVLYDQLADRFVITEFANKSETGSDGLIIAVCASNDPSKTTPNWNVYFYPTTTFPDYPKYSVWGDAYYCKTNDFKRNRYSGATVYAFDKAAMILGNPTASMQKFALGTANKYYSMCPVGLSGTTTAPAGTGGLFAYLNDNSWSGSSVDSVGVLEFDVNFVTPASSALSIAKSLAVAAYTLGSGTAPQPNGGQGLDMLRNRVMNQPQYRNFGSSASIVLAHVADNSVRWYELKNAGTWAVNQQSTYTPDANYRFMPSININASGDIGLSYNTSSTSVFPSIRFTGRKAGDPLNTMTIAEGVLKAGTASSSCSGRYGDYCHLVVDPTDNTTFWMTGMYNAASSWSTYINTFNLTTGVVGAVKKPVLANINIKETDNILKAAVYPNPAAKTLYITLDNYTSESTISIMDITGKTILERKANGGVTKINIEDLSSGVYLIKVINADKSFTYKFVKE